MSHIFCDSPIWVLLTRPRFVLLQSRDIIAYVILHHFAFFIYFRNFFASQVQKNLYKIQ